MRGWAAVYGACRCRAAMIWAALFFGMVIAFIGYVGATAGIVYDYHHHYCHHYCERMP